MPRSTRRPSHDDPNNSSAISVTFNLQEYLAQMEQRLGARIDEVKLYCPNDKRMAKTESLVKWWGGVIIAALASIAGVVAEHLLRNGH